MSFGLFTLKKSVLINKFNTFKLNNEYCKIQCKMGYLSSEENGINMDNGSMNTVPISSDYSYMITNVENDWSIQPSAICTGVKHCSIYT